MAVSKTVTLNGGVGTYDGAKTLTVTSGYNGSVSGGAQTGVSLSSARGAAATDTVTASVADGKITVIDATKAGSGVVVTGGSKATSISISGGGTAIANSTGADKLYGSSGKEKFVLPGTKNAGADAIGDGKTAAAGYDSGDLISLTGATAASLSFADNYAKKSVVVTNNADKGKFTVFKKDNNTPITITDQTGQTITYGVDGSKTSYDGKTLKITGNVTAGSTVDASMLVSTAKLIDATAAKAIYLVGNSQNDNISLGSAGGTVYGGYDYVKNKTTNDNLYGTKTGTGKITYVIDANSGNDNIFNYKDGDVINISAGTGTLDFSSASVLKDGGSGKDVAVTYSGKNKVTIKTNTANKITFNVNGTMQYYGVDMPKDVSLGSGRTELVIGKDATSTSIAIEGWDNGTSTNALKQMAPKLNTINATASTKSIVLEGQASVATTFKGGSGSSNAKTTMIGGTAADQFNGGTGHDVFVVDIADSQGNKIATGKDVVSSVGASDLIMVRGYNEADTTQSIELSSKGVLTYYTDTKSSDYKNNSLTVKTFKSNTASTPVVVVDEEGVILAVNSQGGVPAPTGMTADSKGIVTTDKYTGAYDRGVYVVGDTVNVATGSIAAGSTSTVRPEEAVIDAANYGGAVKLINASVVGSAVKSLYIKGNATVKNTIYVPSKTTGNDIAVTVEGGTANDTFVGNTSTSKEITFVAEAGGKDVIQNYTEDDSIRLKGVTLTGASNESKEDIATDSRISEKNADVVFQFDSKNSLTIKNAAGKAITFIDDEGKTYSYGHVLPIGLEYDSKRTAINASSNFNTATNDFVTVKNGKITSKDDIHIDLSETEATTDNYYPGIKTVSLSGVSVVAADVSGNSIANELYAGSGGATLYGGDANGKADADKLYGNTGKDVFIYKKGQYTDVIGSNKVNNSSLEAQDVIILASDGDSALSRDDVTFTDKKGVLTIQYNGTDATSKASKLTVNLASPQTPAKIYFTNANLSAANGGTDKIDLEENDDYFVYGVDTREFVADASGISNGSLVITGAGLHGAKTGAYVEMTGETATLKVATVNVNDVTSGLKNLSVTAASDTRVGIVGGITALNVTMGAGGGTVEGGAKNNKGLNDKIYASTENATKSRGTIFVFNNATGGKDNVYNYDASRGDILYFEDGAPDAVKFSAKSIVFSYSGGNKSALTLNGTFDSTTNIAIAYGSLGAEDDINSITKTYFGWSASLKNFSDYADLVRNPQWTRPADNTYVFTGKNGVPETVEGGNGNHLGTHYTLRGSSIVDADNNFIPDNVAIDRDGSLSFANTDETMSYIDPNIGNFHVAGVMAAGSDLHTLQAGDKFTANGVEYTLVNVENSSVNAHASISGYELSKNNWVKTGNDTFVHMKATVATASDEAQQGKTSLGSNHSEFTITGALTDPSLVGDGNDVFSNLSAEGTDSNVGSSEVKITLTSDADMTQAHFYLQKNQPFNGNKKFEYSNKYSFTISGDGGEGETAWKRGGVSGDGEVYKLYDADNNSVNGFEFLRTDLAKENGWELLIGNDVRGSVQSNGTGWWKFSDTQVANVAFDISSAAGLKPATNGLPIGITVGAAPDDSQEDTDYTKREYRNNEKNNTTIFFDSTTFTNTANIIFSETTKVGTDTGAVHISGFGVGTGFTVSGKSYLTAELDGDTQNGYELLNISDADGWTLDPTGAWIYSQAASDTKKNNVTIDAVQFTVSAAASLRADEQGRPIGVTVTPNWQDSGATLIDFSGMSNVAVVGAEGPVENTTLLGEGLNSNTSLITFESGKVTTGDVLKTVRIKGFDTDTARFTIGEGTFYLADLDSDASTAELLPVNSNWKRVTNVEDSSKGGWEYYIDGLPDPITEYGEENPRPQPFVTITQWWDANKAMISADENGAPKGISVSGGQITINEGFGSLKGSSDAKGEASNPKVFLKRDMLTLGTMTSVNASGIHIIGATSTASVEFMSGTSIKVLNNSDEGITTDTYTLANLDRNSVNGYEIFQSDTTGQWSFNNGMASDGKVSITERGLNLGSWSFESEVAVGASSVLKLAIGNEITLLPVDASVANGLDGNEEATLRTGTPEGIYVQLSDTKDAMIITSNESIKSSNFVFYGGSETSKALFLSDTGLHFSGPGFSENDIVTIDSGADYLGIQNEGTRRRYLERLRASQSQRHRSLVARNRRRWRQSISQLDLHQHSSRYHLEGRRTCRFRR